MINPDEAVPFGAAIPGGVLNGEDKIKKMCSPGRECQFLESKLLTNKHAYLKSFQLLTIEADVHYSNLLVFRVTGSEEIAFTNMRTFQPIMNICRVKVEVKLNFYKVEQQRTKDRLDGNTRTKKIRMVSKKPWYWCVPNISTPYKAKMQEQPSALAKADDTFNRTNAEALKNKSLSLADPLLLYPYVFPHH
ncbi:hypothetical protein HDU83_000691 [Entophlyctis luteolus]|nr:hypothetical protein HDU83_000691 [Entophlyctis luteolus]